jgi:Coenzyme PQQ synthesis protein D (PqqD)
VISPDSRPSPSPQAVFRGMRDGGVLLHLGSGQYHGLNETGVLIWRLLDGERTVADVTSALRAEVSDPPEDLEGYVSGFLDGLRERDLVTV